MHNLHRILRLSEVIKQTGIPRSSIYVLMNQGAFPKPVPLTTRCIGFVEAEIQDWIAARITARDSMLGAL
jgi:prophage regulatory protein